MDKQKITKYLTLFGLDEVEIRIYLNLLESGAKTPLEISRESNINRSKIYRYLDRLKQKKLVEQSNLQRGLRIKAVDPKNLELLIIEKEHELKLQKDLFPELLKELSFIPSNLQKFFEVKYYHGAEGLKQMLWNRLSAKEILVYGYQTMNEMVGKEFAEVIRKESVHRNIKVYEMEEDVDPGNFTGDFTYTKVSDIKKIYVPRYVDPKKITIRQCTSIFNNTVSIMNWENDHRVGVEIINPQFANMQKQLFWILWETVAKSPTPQIIKKKANVK